MLARGRISTARAWSFAALLGLSLSLRALSAADGKLPAEPKRVVVPRLTGSIQFDGELNEQVWKKAAGIENFVLNETGKPAREKTTLKLWYDDEALYLGFTCVDDDIQATLTNRDSKFWEEEVVECFLAPKQLEHYYELQWNPLGAVFDAIIDNNLDAKGKSKSFKGEWAYTAAGMQSAVKLVGKKNGTAKHDKLWQVEVRIPFKDLQVPTPGPGDVWRANFYRFDRTTGKPVEELSWSPTWCGRFHEPSLFGYLEFAR
jgi:hypothetical protein